MDRRLFLRSALAASVAAGASSRQSLAADFALLTELSSDIPAVSGDRKPLTLLKAEVQELADSLRGNLLMPGNEAYEKARRVLNAGIDKHPAFVVQPAGVTDIRHAVRFAKDHSLLLAVKCGGHSYAGKSTCDGGVQIDLSTFRHARVDPAARKAFVAGGSLLGELDRESMAFGLVTTAGTVSHTGVGGLTVAGGFGRVGRRFGLALDNVKSVDVVTADGSLLHADDEQNEELYWGVRGGGGNFGIVTNFEFGLHPMQKQVFGGEIMYPFDRIREFLEFYAEYSAIAPDDVYCDGMVIMPPGGERASVGMHICYSGPLDKAEKALEPVRKFGKPSYDGLKVVDYVEMQRSWDNTDPRNTTSYMKAGFINEFPKVLIDRVIDGIEPHPQRSHMTYWQHSGGAIGRVPMGDTAFASRRSLSNMFSSVDYALDIDPTEHIGYMRSFWKTLAPNTQGYYTVDTADESQQEIHDNYEVNIERLRRVKDQYDPSNLFRLNANILPASAG